MIMSHLVLLTIQLVTSRLYDLSFAFMSTRVNPHEYVQSQRAAFEDLNSSRGERAGIVVALRRRKDGRGGGQGGFLQLS